MLAAVGAGLFLAALDTYVVVTVLPRMMFDLALPVDRLEQATPIITGFLVGYIVTMPLMGALSDLYGRGRVYFASLCIFSIGSVLTATAGVATFPSETLAGLPWLVAGRVLQGLGGGAMVPVALALAADLFPVGGRALALGAISAIQETGSVVGPLYGAALAGAAAGFGGWRAIFWINLPLALLCAAAFVYALRRGAMPPREKRATGAHVDWPGGALLGSGLALMVLALYPDDPSRHAVGPLFVPLGGLAVASLAGYVWRQARGVDPLIPPALLRNRTFIGANVTNLLLGAGLMVALVDVPIVARGVFGESELGGALLLARFMVAIPFGALAGGWVSNRLGYRLTGFTGLVVAAIAFYRMSSWQADELIRRFAGVPDATLTLVVCGFGFGLVIAPVAAAILDRARRTEHGLASSMVVLARSVGMLLGLSALAAFGIRRFYELFNQSPLPAPAPGSSLAAQAAALQAHATTALLQEYHEIFSITAGICLLAALVALATLSGGGRTRAGRRGPAT
ncbi:MAG TPA: MFS transporter [Candidatus Dormibacteraeota bacterium]|nr:MFS transporter [Candidatus Dormibacteraeota bacterium]